MQIGRQPHGRHIISTEDGNDDSGTMAISVTNLHGTSCLDGMGGLTGLPGMSPSGQRLEQAIIVKDY
jgi:hypothetical protein